MFFSPRSRKILKYLLFFTLGYFSHMLSLLPFKENHNRVFNYNSVSNEASYSQGKIKNDNLDVLLVILIFSSVNNFSKRQTIRETWLSEVHPITEVKHYFVISEGNSENDQNIDIYTEERRYGDLLIFRNLEDSFYTLTTKLIASFGWLTDILVLGDIGKTNTMKPFNDFKFVLKCDDDSFVRVTDILNELKTVFSGTKGENLYWGFFDGRAKPKKTQKYKEDRWNICDFYIPYALGGGYVLAKPMVKFIARNEKYLKKYNNEDVSVGAWLGSYEGIHRFHDPRFDTEYTSRGCHQSYLITHKHSEFAMRNFHNNLKSTKHLCQKEYKTRMSYNYNWQSIPSKCCARNNPNIP